MCGEHVHFEPATMTILGSSPHVWGTLRAGHPRRRGFRFIPACAGNTGPVSAQTARRSVHPRMCGEHPVTTPANCENTGSSPHVRGTRRADRRHRRHDRFIPACAGNTPARRRGLPGRSVHPRMCGEHFDVVQMEQDLDDSSLHVRGTPGDGGPAALGVRFIPACAGNTEGFELCRYLHPVHPRMCGEHVEAGAVLGASTGSSPHVRGTLAGAGTVIEHGRFIPACAGNTSRRPRRRLAAPVHPRMCGEHHAPMRGAGVAVGSSPHVRGTRGAVHSRTPLGRFIPACAGNTAPPGPASFPIPVHPRMCGEHYHGRRSTGEHCGSSPHVRGTPAKVEFSHGGLRFIPACAGNTSPARLITSTPAVHPRMCGEHDIVRHLCDVGYGSSPHVRGTRLGNWSSALRVRFIPACAGNTLVMRVRPTVQPVHPRMCGEHIGDAGSADGPAGSSPHVRGTRAYGDTEGGDSGSSPHVRGTPVPADVDRPVDRFIPACAGNTSSRVDI